MYKLRSAEIHHDVLCAIYVQDSTRLYNLELTEQFDMNCLVEHVVKCLTDPCRKRTLPFGFQRVSAGFKYFRCRSIRSATTPGLEMLVSSIRMTRTRATVPVPGENQGAAPQRAYDIGPIETIFDILEHQSLEFLGVQRMFVRKRVCRMRS